MTHLMIFKSKIQKKSGVVSNGILSRYFLPAKGLAIDEYL